MDLLLKINNEPQELYYCEKHKQWVEYGNEMNCCNLEREELLQDLNE